ncbi:acyl carrier protein [Streptomyces sp. HC44]|uniref:Acyl carrier protein n=1 Tax=Streptomyces scabichelini TaxID=2711217 RepID=A0A6G4VAJ2_9ACTN|nr:acyl carrier protein [Streptomyces scabichelini]NGO11148.1 acyl carrier protein [Streptomyces scabichelini]
MNIREEVVTVLREIGFRDDELADTTGLSEDLGIDSTELVEIVVALEQHFDISIDMDAEGGFRTLGDLVACADRLLSVREG